MSVGEFHCGAVNKTFLRMKVPGKIVKIDFHGLLKLFYIIIIIRVLTAGLSGCLLVQIQLQHSRMGFTLL